MSARTRRGDQHIVTAKDSMFLFGLRESQKTYRVVKEIKTVLTGILLLAR